MAGRKIFACDELQKLTDTNRISQELSTVLETGRRYGLDFAGISQAPNLIHGRIRNQLTEVVTFQTLDRNALSFLADAGFNPQEVSRLAPLHYLARNLTTGGQSGGKLSVRS